MNFLRKFWYLAILLLIVGSALQTQSPQGNGLSLPLIGGVLIFASALWILAALISWIYRKSSGAT